MKKLFLLSSIAFANTIGAQCTIHEFVDSNTLSPIEFNSPIEKEYLESVFLGKDNIDLFALLVSSTSNNDVNIDKYKMQLEDVFKKIEDKKISKLKNKAKAQLIFKTVHNELFKKYEEINAFSEIFDLGRFNCLSASYIYALTFEKFDIPYEVREMPGHIYVIAYPRTESIIVETTDPNSGVIVLNKSVKKQYIKNLLDNKIIEESEITGNFELDFDKHFFDSKIISKTQLASFQYFNYAHYELKDNNLRKAYNNILKSRILNCDEEIETLLGGISLEILSISQDYLLDTNALKIALQYAGTIKNEAERKEIVGAIAHSILEQKLYKTNQETQFDLLSNMVLNFITDSVQRRDLEFTFYAEKARTSILQNKMQKAYESAEKALYINHENPLAQGIFFESMMYRVKHFSHEKLYKEVLSVVERHSYLKEHNGFATLLMNLYLEEAKLLFEKNKISEGELVLENFENLFNLNTGEDIVLNPNHVTHVYATLAYHYKMKNKKEKAKTVINKGLQIIPQNGESLKAMLKEI